MKKKIVTSILIIIYFSITLYLIHDSFNSSYNINSSYKVNVGNTYNNEKFLEIPSINLKKRLEKALDNFSNLDNDLVYYKYFSPQDKIIIFGHSGVGYGTYFNRLDELKKEDNVFLYNKNICYEYVVYDIYNVDETSVHILNEEENSKKLLLITCSKKYKNKRLVISLKLKNVKIIEK